MNANIKKISFISVGLAIVTAIFVFMWLNIATANKQNGKKFDDWVVSCVAKDEKSEKAEICFLTQQLNLKQEDKQQPIALFQVGYFGEKKGLKLIQTLPLGVNLEAGTSVVSSKKLIMPGRYTVCVASGCNAVAPISDEDFKILTSETDNSVVFMNIEGKQMSLPISTKGLVKGLKYIK